MKTVFSCAAVIAALAVPAVASADQINVRAARVAAAQVGVAESPAHSNRGVQVDRFRSAVAGVPAGSPWNVTFVSWVYAEAGRPLGAGFASRPALKHWLTDAGVMVRRADAKPGDLLVRDDGVGVIVKTRADGRVVTVEGNSRDAVREHVRKPGTRSVFRP